MTCVLRLLNKVPQLLLQEAKLFPTSHTNTVGQSLLEKLTVAELRKKIRGPL